MRRSRGGDSSGGRALPGLGLRLGLGLGLGLSTFAALAIALGWVRPAAALPSLASGTWTRGSTHAAEAAATVASGSVVTASRPRLFGARSLSGREPRGRGYVAFTFDDGPLAGTTPLVLAALARYQVSAAFFVCGYQLDGDSAAKRANARTLDAVIAAGHLVGSHTYGHTHLGGASVAFAASEVLRNERLIVPHTDGAAPRLFRPPYGLLSPAAARLLDDLGYTVIRWSIDPDDYRPRTPIEVRDRVIHDLIANDGGIVLMHDTKPWSAKALPMILASLERENCRRLGRGVPPILPVSLDYFATDASGAALPLPPEVEAQTERTRTTLERRCEARAASHRRTPRPVSQPTIRPD